MWAQNQRGKDVEGKTGTEMISHIVLLIVIIHHTKQSLIAKEHGFKGLMNQK